MKNLRFIAFFSIILISHSIGKGQHNEQGSWQFDGKRVEFTAGIQANMNLGTSKNNMIIVEVSGSAEKVSQYQLTNENGSIKINEEALATNPNSPSIPSNIIWNISVPAGTEFKVTGAGIEGTVTGFTGNTTIECGKVSINMEGCNGRTEITSGAGSVRINDCQGSYSISGASTAAILKNCTGDFHISSASGNIDADNIILSGPGLFSSGTGKVSVRLKSSPAYDLSVMSSFSKAELDFCGNPVSGSFEFICEQKGGRITSPYALGTAETFRSERAKRELGNEGPNLTDYTRRSFIRGDNRPKISIRTATGNAILKK